MVARFGNLLVAIILGMPALASAAEIQWTFGLLDEDADVSNFGTVIEALAFTGDRDSNAIAGTIPLEDPFAVNGTMFTPVNFSQGQLPDRLSGLTYDHGEFGHTIEDTGYQALISGLAFQTGVMDQFLEVTGLTPGGQYQVEFYYHHINANRTVMFDDGVGNMVTVIDGVPGVGGFASGYFVADAAFQEIVATANTGSQFLSGYQLREVPGPPPVIEPPLPPVSIPDLIGYWNFDNNVQDQSGHNNHGTIVGGVTFDNDVPTALGQGSSASFDGLAGTYVAIEHNSMMPVTSHTDFTISMWVRGDGTVDNVDDRVFSEGMSTDNNPLFNLGTQNEGLDGRFDFFYRNGSTTGHQYSLGEPFDDEWNHIVWVDRNNVGTLYINGEEDTTFDYTVHPTFEADITAIGAVLRAADCCNFTGLIDDVSIFSFALSDDAILALAGGASPLTIPIPMSVLGDFDDDGMLTAADIDLLTGEVLAGTNGLAFDLNNDALVTAEDRRVWVEELKFTYFGDANLDGEFSSADFVAVFQAGQYEDAVNGNSTWATGDWDGDRDFTSSDFVIAFQAGGYEQGPRAAVAAVPEPSGMVLLSATLLMLLSFAREKSSRRR
jgi:hypothetical protein